MTAYIVRRCLYAIPILLGINLIVFGLFFFVNTPDDMAVRHLGEKRVTPDQIDRFKREHNMDLPYFYNGGWRPIGSISAAAKSNAKTFPTPGAGLYALVVEAPPNVKEAEKAGTRRVRLTCSEPGRLSLPSEFSPIKPDGSEPAGGVLELRLDASVLAKKELPEDERLRRYEFNITPGLAALRRAQDGDTELVEGVAGGDTPPPEVTVGFDLESRGLKHRVVLYYKDRMGLAERFTQTLFWQHSLRMLFFSYGRSMKGKPIGRQILRRMLPSLTVTVPSFVTGIAMTIFFAMTLAFFRGTYVDYWGVVLCVVMMSISWLFYILGAQLVLGQAMRLFPISGYDYGFASWKFIAMPILISVVAGLGGGVRFYRTVFLEEINKDYVRTARAKGLPERTVLFVHVLKNAMIPILTSVIVSLPFLISAGLVLESFFAIPGLGSFTIDGIRAQDFIVVQSMVSLGSFMYVVALLVTDVSYTLVDPRVRLE